MEFIYDDIMGMMCGECVNEFGFDFDFELDLFRK